MAERDEPEAAHERPRAADEGPDEDLHRHVDDVLAGDAEGQEGPREEHGEKEPADDTPPAHCRFAMMPPGRAKIMTMNTTKAIT